MTALTNIRNIGPATAQALEQVGLRTAEDLRDIGADAAYARLLAAGQRPHFIAYYVLVMGLQGRPWNDARGAEKVALRQRFDALVAQNRTTPPHQSPDGPSEALAEALDAMGVVPRGRPTSAKHAE